MSSRLRAITIVVALLYFAASLFHAGVINGRTLPGAVIPEAVLGAVLLVVAILRRWAIAAYVIVLLGTIFGFTIVLPGGLADIDVQIHLAMFAGLAVCFAVWAWERRASR